MQLYMYVPEWWETEREKESTWKVMWEHESENPVIVSQVIVNLVRFVEFHEFEA